MDVSGIANAPKIASWMVDMLFGQQGEAKSEAAPAPAATTPAVAVASGAKSSVAAATGQAIAALPAGGGGPDAPITNPDYMTVAQINTLIASNNAMTSAQISATLYSGGGLKEGGRIDAPVDTFADMIQRERDSAQWWSNEADHPDSAVGDSYTAEQMRATAARITANADSMQKAFDNHTLVIQKMSDVPGLNYVSHQVVGGPGQDQQPTWGTFTESYDKAAMASFQAQFTGGKHMGVPGIGGVNLLMTWTDDSLA